MNTKQLQQDHPEVYEEFYLQNHLIISSSLLIKFCGNYYSEYSGYIINQKLPLRIYIGVSPSNSKEINFHTVTMFDLNKDLFQKFDIKTIWPKYQGFEDKLNAFLDSESIISGGNINLLIESDTGLGTGITSSFFLLLSTCILYKSKKIELSKFQNSWGESINNYETNIKPLMQKISQLYDSKLNISKYYPFCQNMTSILKGFHKFVYEADIDKSMPDIIRLDDKSDSIFPEAIQHTIISIKLNSLMRIGSVINSIPDDLLHNETNKLLGNISNLIYWGLIEYYDDQGNINKFNNLGKMLNLFMKLNIIGNLQNNSYTRDIVDLESAVNKFGEGVFVFNGSNGGFGGHINIIIHNSISNYKQLIESIYNNFQVVYCSLYDGFSNHGISLDQDINNHNYGSNYPNNKVIVSDFNGYSTVISYESANKISADITLDFISGKLLISGKRITSKDLLSQSFTIELIDKLLSNPHKLLNNSDLSASSYSKNKNEIVGKILKPLELTTCKILGSPLKIKCSGSLRDYTISLSENNFKIFSIKR